MIHHAANKRLERTRHERASLLSCVGEPLKRSVGLNRYAVGREADASYFWQSLKKHLRKIIA